MQQKLILWLKFYCVRSFHDVAISIVKSAIGTFSLSSYPLTLHYIESTYPIRPPSIIHPPPSFHQTSSTPGQKGNKYIQRNFEKVRVWVKSRRNVDESETEQQKWQCPELKVCTKNLLILSWTPSIVDVANCPAVFLSFFSLEIFQMSNTSRLSRSINCSQSGLLHCEKL